MIRLTFVAMAMAMAIQKADDCSLARWRKISFYLYKRDLLFDPVPRQHRPPPSSVT
jgi:hypothetical protein